MVELPSPAGTGAAEPFLTLDGENQFLLSWLQRDADSVTVALQLATLGSSGTWSTPTAIVRSTGLFVNWADFPSVVRLANGRLLAHWLQRNGSGKYSYDVRLAESNDGGRSWSASVLAHDANVAAEHGFVTLLPRADSSADVVFLNGSAAAPTSAGADAGGEHRGPPMRLALARWTKEGGISASPVTLDDRTCDCCQTAAAVTAKGPVVLYRDRGDDENRDISVTRLIDGTWTTPRPLHVDGWIIDACPVNGPAISANGNQVAAVWFTGARDTAKVQLSFSTDAGATFGPPIRIDGGVPAGRVDVELLETGDAVVTWIERTGKDSSEVRARVVRADGTAEAALRVAGLTIGRSTGFPRMVRRGTELALAWTAPGTTPATGTIRVATLRVAPR